MAWFAVRSIFRFDAREDQRPVYEERVVLFDAEDADAAIAAAEDEAMEYAADLDGCEVMTLFQSYQMHDVPADRAEVFSLMRCSELEPDEYLDSFFDTGDECLRQAE